MLECCDQAQIRHGGQALSHYIPSPAQDANFYVKCFLYRCVCTHVCVCTCVCTYVCAYHSTCIEIVRPVKQVLLPAKSPPQSLDCCLFTLPYSESPKHSYSPAWHCPCLAPSLGDSSPRGSKFLTLGLNPRSWLGIRRSNCTPWRPFPLIHENSISSVMGDLFCSPKILKL